MTISVNDAAAVVFNDTEATSTDPETGSYPISAGSNRILLVWAFHEIANTGTPIDVNTITWGGQTLTHVRSNTTNVLQSTTEHMELWELDEAGIAAGSGTTLSVDYVNQTPLDVAAIAIALDGDTGALSIVDSNDNANHDVGSISTAIATVAAGNWVLAAVCNEASDGSGFTEEADVDVEDIDAANATGNAGLSYCFQRSTTGSGSITMGVTACGNTDKDMVIIACEVEEAAAAGIPIVVMPQYRPT